MFESFKIRNAFIPALILPSGELLCQSRNFNFAHLDINSGLSHNQVNGIFKDSRGFMWFGTMSGLNRFTFRNCETC